MSRHAQALLPALALLALSRPLAGAGPAGQALVPITGCRSVDTRGPSGPNGGPALGASEVRILPVAGTCGVPSNALGLVVNLTVVRPAALGFAQLYPGDAPAPPTSVLAFTPNKTRAGFALVALASNGSGTVALANGSAGPADYLLDVLGYFVPACTATITVTNPATSTGTVNTPFSQTFTSAGGVGATTFSTASPLPTGLNLGANGVLSGTPTQSGTFPMTVTATDANGCTGSGATYTLVISCQTITVTNPVTTTGTANVPFSQTFTQSGGFGTTTFSTSSPLPIGMALAANGVLAGTPTQAGTFPIVVVATDANGCTGAGATYTLVIACQTIIVTNPATTSGTAGAAFSQTFTQSGAIGGATFTTASTLPTGLFLAANGVLSGTPTQVGTFPIVVKVTDGNLCTGTSATYNLVINCQTIAVNNPATTSGVADTPFSQTFTQAGAIGSATFTTASALPPGLTLAANGTLSGTPTQTGTFPIVVMVTDANGCSGLGATYTLVVACQTYSVQPTSIPPATAGVLYPAVAFKHAGGIGLVTFSETGALPAGMSFVGSLLLGTPTQTGSFPFTVTATDANGCTASRDYVLVVTCSGVEIALAPASLPAVDAGSAFPATTFTASGSTGPYTFQEVGALPSGMNFVTDTLSGTPTQTGAFPITIVATDAAGCVGSRDYVVTVTCAGVTITVAPPSVPSVAAGSPFTPVTFTASGGTGPHTFARAGVLPTGMAFSVDTLSGTPTQQGTFPFTITATDANGCVGSTNYSLVVTCPAITVTNPGVATGTVNAAFSQTFTQSGGALPITFSLGSGTLPTGLNIDPATGVLSGTPTQSGSFPITVKATDANGCTGTGATYTLVIACQTITVTNPVVNGGADGAPFSQTFTQTGGVGATTFSLASGALPGGWTLTSAGVLANAAPTPVQFTITVRATDANGCTGTGASYTVAILPNVVNDTYAPAIVGNMSVDTATGTTFSVLTNDSAGTTANLVGGGTTAQGGTVSLDSLGRFTYNPPRGYDGPDSFQYTATHTASGLTSAPATVSLTVAGMVWFVDNNAGACVSSCDGRRTNPYTALDLFQAVNNGTPTNPQAGDAIFLVESATPYTGPAAAPVALLNNQKLVGQDFAGTFAAATGLTVPDTTVAVPVLTPGAPFSAIASVAGQNIVLLASGNTIRGLTLSPANNAAVAFVGPGSIGTATVDQVILSLAGSGSGIGLALHTGTLNVQNSSIVGGGIGTAVAVSGAANGSAAFTNTPVTRTAGRLLDVQSRTAGGAVTFDAASVLTLTGAATDGIVLQNNASTTLSLLGGFSVTTTAGRGFFANATGTVTIGGASNLINATGGAALDVTSTTIAGAPVFTSVSSTNPSSQGILLSSAAGGLSIGSTTVSGTGTQRILVTGSTVNAAFGNTTLNGGSDAVSLQNNSAGTRSFGTLTIGNTTPPTGVGFLHAVGGGSTTVSGLTSITNGSANGVDIQNSTTAITFSGVTITKTSGTGVNLVSDALVTFGALSVTSPVTGSGLVSTGSSVSTNGGTIAVTGGPAVSATNTNFNASSLASASSTGSASQGVSLTTCTGSLTMSGGSITGATAIPFVVNGGTVSATYAGGITQSAANAMVSVSGGHNTGTITFQTGTLSATNGSGLQFDNADGAYAFNGTTTLNGGDAGVDILNGSSGSFTFSSAASINNPTGIAYREDTSTATVAFDGTITKNNNAANAVKINAKTGGSTTFSGAITASTSTANAIDLTNTGGTVTFRGGLSATTTSGVAFNATGTGTTVAVCDENPCNPAATGALVNTLTSTTGTALNVVNTTIGANNLEFRSISANGGANGIVLNGTGATGGLKIKGNGGNCTPADTTCSGGTLQNMTGGDDSSATPVGTAIVLNNTQNVSLTRVRIRGNSNYGIRGTSVVGFVLDSSLMDGTTGTNGATPFNDGCVSFDNLTGTATVSSSNIQGGLYNNFRLVNTSGTLNRITFSSVTFDVSGANPANDALTLESQGAAVVNVTVQNSFFKSAAGDLFQLNNIGTGADDLIFTGNTLTNGNSAIATGGGGVTIGSNGTGNITSNFSGNTLRDAVGAAILFFKSTGAASVTGTFDSNTIGVSGVANSGSAEGDGLKVQNAGQGTVKVTITNNQIRQYNNFGIELLTGGGATLQSGALNATITGNTIAQPGNTAGTIGIPKNGIHVNGGTVPGDTYQLCVDIRTNTLAGSGAESTPPSGLGAIDFRLRQRQATTIRLPGYAGANNDNAAVVAFVQSNNAGGPTGLASNTVPTGGGFTGGAGSCP